MEAFGGSVFLLPGDRVLVHDGRIYRFTQDAESRYGIQVYDFEKEEISKILYEEKIVPVKSAVTMSEEGWNGHGIHHGGPHFMAAQCMAAVDGTHGPSTTPCKTLSAV